MIDLHCHSTHSDGTLTPRELVNLALEKNLKCLALTDHDTTSGLDELFKSAQGTSLEVITGVEISTTWYTSSLHIIGLFIDPSHGPLNQFLDRVVNDRDIRNEKMIERLNFLGYSITLEECINEAGGDILGRPHLASLLVKKGYFSDLKTVFDELLATGKNGYIRRYLPMPHEAIQIIHQAGGLAIWAHPYAMRSVPFHTLKKTASILENQGLDGIECYYSHFTPTDQDNVNRLIKGMPKLLHSGGSDFHGTNSPGVQLGTGIDRNISIPYDLILKMKNKLGRV